MQSGWQQVSRQDRFLEHPSYGFMLVWSVNGPVLVPNPYLSPQWDPAQFGPRTFYNLTPDRTSMYQGSRHVGQNHSSEVKRIKPAIANEQPEQRKLVENLKLNCQQQEQYQQVVEKRGGLKELSPGLLQLVFERLEWKDLRSVRLVCKTWCSVAEICVTHLKLGSVQESFLRRFCNLESVDLSGVQPLRSPFLQILNRSCPHLRQQRALEEV
eukprot:TRINITY_DN1558_c2_g1_i3.p2 TRINITY_DN1558_c2_g1~~TRINITY_DN1558_c2_g1_i3.p2  ORF type:complete len:212 (-),score=13.65 TRINITY_DN1558_c2_g1_i3:163-798(-)